MPNPHTRWGIQVDDDAITIIVNVPGCTCETRTQEQLDRVDVCDACVSYFDLGTD